MKCSGCFQYVQKIYIMPGRAGGSRGSAPNTPNLNEARPTTISSEGLSGRRGAPTGAKVRGVTLVMEWAPSRRVDAASKGQLGN
jgi:hypothetical protein